MAYVRKVRQASTPDSSSLFCRKKPANLPFGFRPLRRSVLGAERFCESGAKRKPAADCPRSG